jgi:hypothetical protein
MLLYSCSPRTYRVESLGRDGYYLDGLYYLTQEQDSILVRLASAPGGKNLIFNVQVVNKSSSPLLVAPEQFRTLLSDTAESGEVSTLTVHALDPEAEIASVERLIENENRSYRAFLGFAIVGDVASLIGSIATLNKEKSEEEQEKEKADEADKQARRAQREYEHHTRLLELEAAREAWTKGTLRKTTLQSFESVHGTLHVPFHSDYKNIVLLVPLRKGSAVFRFRLHE